MPDKTATPVVPFTSPPTGGSAHPVAISLFSGGGGLDIGIEQAGFATLACVEIDAHCCETLRHNRPRYFRHAEVIHASVRDIDVGQLMEDNGLQPGDLDLLCGGPPCQTFSQIGQRQGLSDERGLLLFELVRFARHLRPKAILIENVKALLTASDLSGKRGGVLQKLLHDLRELGYELHVNVLNTADFGVPQVRQRALVIGVPEGSGYEFPLPSHAPDAGTPYTTVEDALSGLGSPASRDERDRPDNHVDVTPAGDVRRIHYVPEGRYLAAAENAPADIKGRLTKKDTTKFLRVHRKQQAKTLRCGEIFFHPTEDRYLTPREYMRLHQFPDDYELQGPIRGRSGSVKNLDQHRQVANSVPPPLGRVVAQSILKSLQRAGEMSWKEEAAIATER